MINQRLLESVLECKNCKSQEIVIHPSSLVCKRCHLSQDIWQESIIVDPELGTKDVLSDEPYESQTKHFYQSSHYAKRYLARYRHPASVKGYYGAFIAKREQLGVMRMMDMIAKGINVVLDIPAGTGKLAKVHSRYQYNVIASDVSLEMLRAGLSEWDSCRNLAGLVQADICNTNFSTNSIDCTVCLRLMHRLPERVTRSALEEIHRITRHYLIISTGIDRFCLASFLRRKESRHGGRPVQKEYWRNLLSSIGIVQQEHYVSNLFSREQIALVKIK